VLQRTTSLFLSFAKFKEALSHQMGGERGGEREKKGEKDYRGGTKPHQFDLFPASWWEVF